MQAKPTADRNRKETPWLVWNLNQEKVIFPLVPHWLHTVFIPAEPTLSSELASEGRHWDFGHRWKTGHVQKHWITGAAGAKPSSGLVVSHHNSTHLHVASLLRPRLESGSRHICWWVGQHLHCPHIHRRDWCQEVTWNVETICASLSKMKENSTWVTGALKEGKTKNNTGKAQVK